MSDALVSLLVADTFTYGPETIISMRTKSSLFGSYSSNTPSVGNCVSSQIEITMKNVSDVIPKMAKLVPYVTVDGVKYQKGLYFIDTRELDSPNETLYDTDALTINGYDPMLKTEQSLYMVEDAYDWKPNEYYYVDEVVKYNSKYYKCISSHMASSSFDGSKWEETEIGDQGTWPKSDITVVELIARRIGVTVNPTVRSIITKGYDIEYPGYGDDGYTIREVLGYIGAMYAGNWIIDDNGQLKIIQLNETKIAKPINQYDECKTSPAQLYSRVTIDLLAGEYYTAGDDTGEELLVECPWVTQEIANDILRIVSGFIYKPYNIDEALYDPTYILGDKITVGDTESYIYSLDINFDYMPTANMSAPTSGEINHEYNFKDLGSKAISSTLNKLKTSLIVQAGYIGTLISGEIRTYRSAEDPSTALGAVMHVGDIWYCTSDFGRYKGGSMYRWNGSTWEEVSATVNVAPDWEASHQYFLGDIVTYDSKWYECTSSHMSTETFDPSKWKQLETITQVAESRITQTIDNITLSVTSGSNGSKISLTSGGVTIDSALVDMHVKSVNIEGTITADEIVANATITSPTITAGGADAGVVEVSSSGINFGSRGDNLTIGLGYREVGTNHFPVIMMGQGIDASGTDQGMIKKYANGIWIGDNDDADYSSPGASRTSNGIFVDFQNGKIYKYINGAASELGSATFGE